MGWFKKLTGMSTSSALGLAATAGAAYATGGTSLGMQAGAGGLSGLLGQVAQGAIGLGSDYAQTQVNLAAQKDLAKYNAEQQSMLNQQAFDQNVKMWNMQNAYNTPAQQMKRLQAAGMNPNLVYGGGSVTGNTAGSAPELQAARFDTGPYHPVDTRMERAQLALAMASQFQQVENQKIQNDLARQRLSLAERAADRADQYMQFRTQRVNLGLTNKIESDKELKERQRQYDREYQNAMAKWRDEERIHKESRGVFKKLYSYIGDPWYKNNPQPKRKTAFRGHGNVIYYGHRL